MNAVNQHAWLVSVCALVGACTASLVEQGSDDTSSTGPSASTVESSTTQSGETTLQGSTTTSGGETTSLPSSTSTSTGDTELFECDLGCAPPAFALSWQTDTSELGSEVAAQMDRFTASVSPLGEAWVFAGDGTEAGPVGVLVVSPQGELRAEWTLEDLSIEQTALHLEVGPSGFALSGFNVERQDLSTVSWFDLQGQMLCAAQVEGYVREVFAQRDGGWLVSTNGALTRHASACDPNTTFVGDLAALDTRTPFIVDWNDGTFMAGGIRDWFGIGHQWFIDIRSGEVEETWERVGGTPVTMAGIAADGRAIVAGSSKNERTILAVDPATITAEEWPLDPAHGYPIALLPGTDETWLLNTEPRTVSDLDGPECCAMPLEVSETLQFVTAGPSGDGFIVVEHHPEDGRAVFSRYAPMPER